MVTVRNQIASFMDATQIQKGSQTKIWKRFSLSSCQNVVKTLTSMIVISKFKRTKKEQLE